MKIVKISRNSFNARLFMSTYGTYSLPKNTLSYYIGLLFAYIFFLPSWPGHLSNFREDNYNSTSLFWSLHIPIMLLLGAILTVKSPISYLFTTPIFHNYFVLYVLGLIISALLILSAMIISVILLICLDCIGIFFKYIWKQICKSSKKIDWE